ncbi:beta-hexosaminidase 1 [Aristolochia californica]|uniref:beta-hexosaminidase 1 n=1 Tax=Aristolochia californica TaxID=171875 RepID=UPI0035D8DC9D
MSSSKTKCIHSLLFFLYLSSVSFPTFNSLVYLWPVPKEFSFGNGTIPIDPNLSFQMQGVAEKSEVLQDAFRRCKTTVFNDRSVLTRSTAADYALSVIKVVVESADESLQLGVDESYSLFVAKDDGRSIIGEATIEANTIYGALRGLETFSQLCTFNYETKSVEINNIPWYIQDEPRFPFRGLMLDTSRHYLPINVIKQIIESMSYAKLNVLHWHIIDEESFPLEVPSYPDLWKGSYTKWEKYTVEDAHEIVRFAKMRGISIMAEVDIPGHARSWGVGYPDLWPSITCTEPLDVTKNFTFDVISGILSDMRKIFPFELVHLGGDEVHPDCWNSTLHVSKWLQDNNMTTRDAYQYFVSRAQQIAITLNWTPVNWEETFIAFKEKLSPRTIIHNWLNSGICPQAVAEGFRCIYSNQGLWYLDHLDVPWEEVYTADPMEGIHDKEQGELLIGGEVCMWGETADTSDVQQTIWPRAAAAAERMWSTREVTSTANLNSTVLPRLEYFRCLLNRRGIPAAPVRNFFARRPPIEAGSCYSQ